MQSGLGSSAHTTGPSAFHGGDNPFRDLGIGRRGRVGRLFIFGDGWRLGERREPAVLKQHAVGRSELGDLVEAAANEVAGHWGIAFLRQIRGLAVHDCL